jgi:hypothetical protein
MHLKFPFFNVKFLVNFVGPTSFEFDRFSCKIQGLPQCSRGTADLVL